MDKEKYYRTIIAQNGSCLGLNCAGCPFYSEIYCSKSRILRLSKVRLGELNKEVENVPKLEGKWMRVSNDNNMSDLRYVWGRLPNGYLLTTSTNDFTDAPSVSCWTIAKPIDEIEELTMKEVCALLGREIRIKKG